MSISTDPITQLPAGTWEVDAKSSELGFGARGMFGLVPVHGHFGAFSGTLSVDDASAHGELTVQAESLDTHNAKRDEHLRSADFFDVATHPTLAFELTGIESAENGQVTASGMLRIRESAVELQVPVTVSPAGSDRVVLSATVDVDRGAAGVGWSKLGMVKGKAHLSAKLTLIRRP
jgi:polyisoprenoid-binding protein YceI